MAIQFSKEIRTEWPPADVQGRELLIVDKEVCFVDPKTVKKAYIHDFGLVQSQMRAALELANETILKLQLSDAFLTRPLPAKIGQSQFLIIDDEICLVDPSILDNSPYTCDLRIVAARVQAFVLAEYQDLDATKKRCFLPYVRLLNQQIREQNAYLSEDPRTTAWTECLMKATENAFSYCQHLSIQTIEGVDD